MSQLILTLFNAVVSDALNAAHFAAASTGATTASEMLRAITEQRQAVAANLLLDELKLGRRTLENAELPPSVAIFHRIQRAAEEGAALLNLRLLAGVFAGQVVHRSIAADDFLYLADILAPLKREEVIVLGTFARLQADSNLQPDSARDLQLKVLEELVPHVFYNDDAFMATAGALLRTGFLMESVPPANYAAQMSGFIYRPTHLLGRLRGLLDIEGVVKRHDDSKG